MRYKTGDTVVLRSDLEEGEWVDGMSWLDSFASGGRVVTIRQADSHDYTYRISNAFWISEDMIDHEASEQLLWENIVDTLSDTFGPADDDAITFNIRIHGAKEYRDKLEELHRHIETVERTIEQLNEMDMSIEVDSDDF